ncbi:MAG: hypothetical protein AAGI03_00585 [Pseudomonadota bacterium]
MSETYGLTFAELSESAIPRGSSLKTWQALSAQCSRPYSATWPEWVTWLRQDYSRRAKLAAHISASGFSSWPTARAAVGGYTRDKGQRGSERLTLEGTAEQWPTPMAGTPAQNGNSAAGNSDFSRKAEAMASELWATPAANPFEQSPETRAARSIALVEQGSRPIGQILTAQARLWTTPQAHDVTQRGGGQVPTAKAGNACLAKDAAMWATPRENSATGADQAKRDGAPTIQTQAQLWASPAGRDYRTPNRISFQDRSASTKGEQLPNQVAHRFRPLAPAISQRGPISWQTRLATLRLLWAWMKSSHGRSTALRLFKKRRTRRLNPLFVEWLMRWPPGHALCDCSATEWTQWQQHMRGAISRLPISSGPWIWKPMQQGSLFE